MVSFTFTDEEFHIIVDMMYEHSQYLDSLADHEQDHEYLEKFDLLYQEFSSVLQKKTF